jgi:hypothetical protein
MAGFFLAPSATSYMGRVLRAAARVTPGTRSSDAPDRGFQLAAGGAHERERIGTCAARPGRLRLTRSNIHRRPSLRPRADVGPSQGPWCGSLICMVQAGRWFCRLRPYGWWLRAGWLLLVADAAVRAGIRGLFDGLVHQVSGRAQCTPGGALVHIGRTSGDRDHGGDVQPHQGCGQRPAVSWTVHRTSPPSVDKSGSIV